MNSKENYADITADKLVNKINDLIIGEDSTDYLTINSCVHPFYQIQSQGPL